MSECKYCKLFKERYEKDENGFYILYRDKERDFTVAMDEPKCAFEGEEFSRDNWSCQTLSLLRSACPDIFANYEERKRKWGLYWRRDDIGTICVIPVPEEVDKDTGFIILVFYKDRGRVDNAIRVTLDKVETLKRDLAERMVDWLFENGKVKWWDE